MSSFSIELSATSGSWFASATSCSIRATSRAGVMLVEENLSEISILMVVSNSKCSVCTGNCFQSYSANMVKS